MFLPFESLSASESSVRPEDQWCTIVSGMDESKVITVCFFGGVAIVLLDSTTICI